MSGFGQNEIAFECKIARNAGLFVLRQVEFDRAPGGKIYVVDLLSGV